MPRDEAAPLFRPESLAEQEDRWLGTVLLLPRLPHTLLTAAVVMVVAGLIALFGFGEYTRKVRLTGWLAPERGLLQVVAPQSGVLTQIAVSEGTEVEKGTRLAVLSTERQSGAIGETQGEVIRALRSRLDILRAESQSHETLSARQQDSHEARLEVIAAEAAVLDEEFTLQRERLALAEAGARRQRELRERGLTTEDDLRRSEEAAFEQALALQALERSRAGLSRSRVELETEIAERPLRLDLQRAEIDGSIAQLMQELAEAEAAREMVITASQAGTVTAVRVAAGDGVSSTDPILTLIPAGTELQARLYGPSRDIGFVTPGQKVLIRYDAFPYQKFGQYEGVVRDVSRATVGPGELAEATAASLTGIAPTGQPAYRITVDLAAQTATAYGQPAMLQPGMTLNADVQIETRPLWRWLLDPLYSLRGGRQT
jgi:membrane fusion protein